MKVLEAMAMQRAVVSTTSGCGGLGLDPAKSVLIGDTAEDFANAIAALLGDPGRRRDVAMAAYEYAVRQFDWRSIGEKQRAVLRELLKAC